MPGSAEGVFARRSEDGATLIGPIPGKPGIGGAAPAGGARNPALGRPGNPTGGHYDPSASSSLDWDWPNASSQEARTRSLCLWRKPEARSRQWSAEWRARRSQDARPPQGGRLMVAPPGAPFPSHFEGPERDYGLPGAAKNTGDDACLIETWLFENADRG